MQRIAVIDLGSNTTRMIVMGYTAGHSFRLLDEVRESVRLAEGIGSDGALTPAAMERGIVVHARDLAKLKTWAQAFAIGFGGYSLAGAWRDDFAWWSILVAVVFTWASAIDYARAAPQLLWSGAAAKAGAEAAP